MIIGLFVNPYDVESLLVNLNEMDIREDDISVLAANAHVRHAVGNFSGSLNSIHDIEGYFEKVGMNDKEIQLYTDGILQGYILVAVAANPDAAETVRELFSDLTGQNIHVVAE